MIFKKDEWVLRKMSGMVVCDKFYLSVVVSSPGIKGIFPGWWNSWGRYLWQLSFFRGFIFRQIGGVQRNPLPAFTVFQVPTVPSNHYIKVVNLGCQVLNSCSHIVGWRVLLPFITTSDRQNLTCNCSLPTSVSDYLNSTRRKLIYKYVSTHWRNDTHRI